jgi:signal transduction histidine kinase
MDMNDSDLFGLLEDALRAQLATRCRRAYHHDMKNGLQGIYGGVDALIRAARADKPMVVPLDQLVQFVRHAMTNHEHGLERVLTHIAPDREAAASVDVTELLTDLGRFLMSDASRHSVRLRCELSGALIVQTQPARLRLVCLGLITESIDAMPKGGEIILRGAEKQGVIEVMVIDTRIHDSSSRDPFALDPTALRSGDVAVTPVARHIVESLGGVLECVDLPAAGRQTTVRLPRA